MRVMPVPASLRATSARDRPEMTGVWSSPRRKHAERPTRSSRLLLLNQLAHLVTTLRPQNLTIASLHAERTNCSLLGFVGRETSIFNAEGMRNASRTWVKRGEAAICVDRAVTRKPGRIWATGSDREAKDQENTHCNPHRMFPQLENPSRQSR